MDIVKGEWQQSRTFGHERFQTYCMSTNLNLYSQKHKHNLYSHTHKNNLYTHTHKTIYVHLNIKQSAIITL